MLTCSKNRRRRTSFCYRFANVECFWLNISATSIEQDLFTQHNSKVSGNTGRVTVTDSLWMWRRCLLPCTKLKDLKNPDESPMYALYCYRFSYRSVQQCFRESIAKLADGFSILTTVFAAFRNCRSVRSNLTAQAHLCFPLSDEPANRETSQGKPGKYHT